MSGLFLNPWSMFIGGALISAPIIIHLINRMRYRRVPWAAMEFLLKSQKKNRRKLIIEQLILLMLRILLVLLVALLLARFLGFSAIAKTEEQQTLHVIVLDDTPSMSDSWREDGVAKSSFDQALREPGELIVKNILGPASQATTPQEVQVVRLSDVENPRRVDRLNAQSIEELKNYFRPLQTTPLRLNVLAGINRAKQIFDGAGNVKRVLHVVSDFRRADWSGANEEALTQAFAELEKGEVQVYLFDVAHPFREQNQKQPLHHDNLAIVDLRPDSRVAARDMPVEFTVFVANYSNAERKNVRVAVKVNGSERAEGSVNIPSLAPNAVTPARFVLALNRVGGEATPEEPLKPFERFNLVSAHLENEQAGLRVDNVRYAVVEVRERMPLLMIEGKPSNLNRNARGEFVPANKDAETFYLWKLFSEPVKGFKVELRPPADLENANLQQYVGVVLCDVPRLSDAALKKLDDYVRSGGGVAFFMGPDVKPTDVEDFYNKKLYADGQGMFPAPLNPRPANEGLAEQERQTKRAERLFSNSPQIWVRENQRTHPALERLYTDTRGTKINPEEYEKFLRFVVIDRYFEVPRLKWKQEGGVQELLTLPNFRPMSDFTAEANRLAELLPPTLDKFAAYKDTLSNYRTQIRSLAASGQPLNALADALKQLLEDTGGEGTKRPNLEEYWKQPENADLAREIREFRDRVRYGDPLYIAKQYGSGRVLAFMASAGASWNDLEGFGKAYYVPLMIEMQRYLGSAGTDVNHIVGTPVEMRFDALQYTPKVRKAYLGLEARGSSAAGKEGRGETAGVLVDRGEQTMETKDNQHRLAFDDAIQPGVYLFEFTEQRAPEPGKGTEPVLRPEYRAFAYNIDAAHEGDLRRTDRDDLRQIVKDKKAVLYSPAEVDKAADMLKARQSDLSESPWLYLVILLVLLAEQAMAVHLSFHTKSAAAAEGVPSGPALGHGMAA